MLVPQCCAVWVSHRLAHRTASQPHPASLHRLLRPTGTKLSSEAKDQLFGGTRGDLDKLVNVMQAQKNVASFANHSNSGAHVTGMLGAFEAAREFGPMIWHDPASAIPVALGAVAAYGGAHYKRRLTKVAK
jgi:hypothetical protein